MKRRSLLAMIGSLTAGGVGLTATGAFTAVSADRDVSVAVVNESNAYLGMESGTGQSGYTRTYDDNRVHLDINGEASSEDGIGVGVNSTYTFDGVIQVTNQGTQTVYLKAPVAEAADDDSETGELANAYFYVADADDTPLSGDEAGFDGAEGSEVWLKLPVGTPAQLGFYLDSTGASLTEQGSLEELKAEIKAQSRTPNGPIVDNTGSVIQS